MRPARPHKHDEPYTQYVKGLAEGGYPNLAQLYHFLHEGDKSRYKSKAWYLELDLDGQTRERKKIDRTKLKGMAHKRLNDVLARIFVIEDLDTEMIEILGDSLKLEADFFSDHISDSFGENSLANGRCRHLPSVSKITSFYTIDYFTAITLNKTLDNRHDDQWRCDFNVRRRVDSFHANSPSNEHRLSRVAFVRRKFSFHIQRYPGSKDWKVVVLADPQIGDLCKLVPSPRNDWPSLASRAEFKAEKKKGEWRYDNFKVRSFQGGYLDIPPPPPKFQQCCPTPKPKPDRRVTKLSPAEDLIYYWLKQGGTDCSKANSSRPESAYTAKNAHKPSPRASTSTKKGSEPGEEERCQQRRFLFDISRNALFIAASECMLVLEALQASADARTWDLKKLDLSESAWVHRTTTTLENFQDDALRLKHQLTGQRRSIRRVMEFVKSVADIPTDYQVLANDFTLGTCIAPPKCKGNADGEGSQSCVKEREETKNSHKHKKNDYGLLEDFEYITRSMEDYHEACSSMVETISNLMAVRDGHLSGSLSRLAMFFAPMSIACSALSLPGGFAPGQSFFWVFWIIWPTGLLIIFGMSFVPLPDVVGFFQRCWSRGSSSFDDVDDGYDGTGNGSSFTRVIRELLAFQPGESSIVRNGKGNDKIYHV